MSKIQFDKGTVQKLFDERVISQAHVSPSTLTDILRKMDKGDFKVWADPNFDPANEPGLNAGINVCYDCGKMYWVTPMEDAYSRPNTDDGGKVCDPCLLKPITGRDHPDFYFEEREINLN